MWSRFWNTCRPCTVVPSFSCLHSLIYLSHFLMETANAFFQSALIVIVKMTNFGMLQSSEITTCVTHLCLLFSISRENNYVLISSLYYMTK